jgi:uncharacterized protein (UPF0179 family)
MMTLRFVLDFYSQSCLQNDACRGCRHGLTCLSHMPGRTMKKNRVRILKMNVSCDDADARPVAGLVLHVPVLCSDNRDTGTCK